jgi:phosphoribosylformylglycinamidine (FGAM) synthase PurS component
VDKKMKVRIMNKEDMSDPRVHCITSDVGRKSGVNSAQNAWTGSLKI